MTHPTDPVAVEVARLVEAHPEWRGGEDELAQIYRYLHQEMSQEAGLDPLEQREALMEEDDPEPETWYQWLTQRVPICFGAYQEARSELHSREYALAYARALYLEFDETESAKDGARRAAYQKLRSDWRELTMLNPAYAEAYLSSLRQGRSETYARILAEQVVQEDGRGLSSSVNFAASYEMAVQRCLHAGHSLICAQAYALELHNDTNDEYAQIYGKVYERKLEEGWSHREASTYADAYTHELGASWPESLPGEEDHTLSMVDERTEERLRRKRAGA